MAADLQRSQLGAGRDMLARRAYDALILDLMLPDGDGLDLCRELRASPRTRSLPVLMLSARASPPIASSGSKSGQTTTCPPFRASRVAGACSGTVASLWRRGDDGDVWRFGRLEIDNGLRQVRLDGQPLRSHVVSV